MFAEIDTATAGASDFFSVLLPYRSLNIAGRSTLPTANNGAVVTAAAVA
jgi:hypothetical protein